MDCLYSRFSMRSRFALYVQKDFDEVAHILHTVQENQIVFYVFIVIAILNYLTSIHRKN